MSSEINSGLELVNIFTVVTKAVTAYTLLVSIPLYTIIVYTIIKNKNKFPFNSSFFNIFVAFGFCDIMAYLFYVIKKLPYWGVDIPLFLPYNQNNAYCTILYFAIWWFSFMQYQYSILSTLNRFISIMMRNFYLKYCTSRVTNIVLVTVAVYSFVLASPILFTGGEIASTKINFDGYVVTRNFGPVFVDPTISFIYNTVWRFNNYICISIVVIVHVILYFKIRAMRGSVNSKYRMEINLAYAATILVFINLIVTAYFIFRDVMVARYQEFGKYSEWTLYLVSDVVDVANGYAIFVMSRDVRKAVWATIKRTEVSQTNQVMAFQVKVTH